MKYKIPKLLVTETEKNKVHATKGLVNYKRQSSVAQEYLAHISILIKRKSSQCYPPQKVVSSTCHQERQANNKYHNVKTEILTSCIDILVFNIIFF